MQRMRKTLFILEALLTIAGALTLFGCTGTDGQATADEVNNKAFTFPNGAVFQPALANVATTLEFTNKAANFTLSSAGGTATGNSRFGSCILTVANSTYTPGTGPQVNDVITLNPCDFDSTNRTLMVANGSTTATSNPAITRVVNATASDLNDKSFLFSNGAIFHSALANLLTTLQFTNSAINFTLSSSDGITTSTVMGNNAFTSGSCTLTVTSSTYKINTGPQVNDVIKLSTCQFNSSNGALILSNGTITISSI